MVSGTHGQGATREIVSALGRKRARCKYLSGSESPDVQSAQRTDQAKNFAGGWHTGLAPLLEKNQKHRMRRQERVRGPFANQSPTPLPGAGF